LVLGTGPVEIAFDFDAGFFAAGLVANLALGLTLLETFLANGFGGAFAFELLSAVLEGVAAFLLFDSVFEAALGEAFFGATVTFGNLTSR
jgi:hypothetical protein